MGRDAILVWAVAGAMGLTAAAFGAGSVVLSPQTTFQTIDGFGACLYPYNGSAPYSVNNLGTTKYQTFMNQYLNDFGASMVRMEFSPDALPTMPAGGLSADVNANINLLNWNASNVKMFGAFAQAANAQAPGQLKLIGSLWSPPAWMKANNSTVALNGGNDPNNHLKFDSTNLATANIDPTTLTQFARYVTAFVKGLQVKFNAPVYAISLQNELQFNETYNSCNYLQSGDYFAGQQSFIRYGQLVQAVKAEFAANGINTQIIGPENVGPDGDYFTRMSGLFLDGVQRVGAMNDLGIVATHGYASDGVTPSSGRAAWSDFYQNTTSQYGKQVWQTETSGDATTWLTTGAAQTGALGMALRIHDAMVYGHTSAWLYWQIADGGSNPSTYTLMGSSTADVNNPNRQRSTNSGSAYQYNYKYEVLKHYADFVKPGAEMIAVAFRDANGNLVSEDPNGLNIDAYRDDAARTLVLELINMGSTSATTTLDLSALTQDDILKTLASFQQYLTDQTHPWSVLPDVAVNGGLMTITVPAYSLTTLSGAAPVAAPEPASLGLLAVGALGLLRRRRA